MRNLSGIKIYINTLMFLFSIIIIEAFIDYGFVSQLYLINEIFNINKKKEKEKNICK